MKYRGMRSATQRSIRSSACGRVSGASGRPHSSTGVNGAGESGVVSGIAVVIVNYRTAGLAADCLRSLAPEVAARPGTRVVVVDNASGDGSAAALAEAVRGNGWDAWAAVWPLDRNGGFAAGHNAALRPILAGQDPPDYLWL